jgi:hypothetical protein
MTSSQGKTLLFQHFCININSFDQHIFAFLSSASMSPRWEFKLFLAQTLWGRNYPSNAFWKLKKLSCWPDAAANL